MGKRGGPGRGQGMKPMYNEAMKKLPVSLSAEMCAYLGSNASAALRALLEWADSNKTVLLEDPGPALKKERQRTSYALATRHLRIAEELGDGSRVAGIRKAIWSAVQNDLVVDALLSETFESSPITAV